MSRYNRHRRDLTHKEIVQALQMCGCSVRDVSQVGDGGADLIVGLSGRDYQIEVKSAHGELSEAQTKAITEWKGANLTVLWSAQDAISWVNRERAWRRFEPKLQEAPF